VPTKKKPTAVKKSTTSRAAKAPAKAYHHGDLRRALIAAAHDELVEVGREALSLRSVSRRASVTHTSAYHYFADKGALLSAMAAEGFDALDAAMRDEMERAVDEPRARLLASGTGYLKMAAADPATYDLMFNAPSIHERNEGSAVGADAFERLFQAVVAVRTAAGTTVGDELTDAMVMWEAVHGCAMLAFSGQLSRMGLDLPTHGRRVLERLTNLYFPATSAVPAGEGP
jgi:AcrR family transcriptional regulator